MTSPAFYHSLRQNLNTWAQDLGFSAVGVTDTHVQNFQPRFQAWLHKGYHGQMAWLESHQDKRFHPEALMPGTLRVICARMNYLPANSRPVQTLKTPQQAYIARYAQGRDYHKVARRRMAALGDTLKNAVTQAYPEIAVEQRAFVDSAPILERPLAEKAGLGWTGKNTLILHQEAGSFFFLAELFTNLPLPLDQQPQANQCGSCQACLQICPTDAFVAPYVLDASRCIAYLTIENKGPIPEPFRQPMGNRVFGCDDCQIICPWNKHAQTASLPDFSPRASLDAPELLTLFNWSEAEFLHHTQGTPLRRLNYQQWQRNLAIGLGNAPSQPEIQAALQARLSQAPTWLAEHFHWALHQQSQPQRRRLRKLKRPLEPNALIYPPPPP